MRLIQLIKDQASNRLLLSLLLPYVISKRGFIIGHIHDGAHSLEASPHILFENTRGLLHIGDWLGLLLVIISLVQLYLKLVVWLC